MKEEDTNNEKHRRTISEVMDRHHNAFAGLVDNNYFEEYDNCFEDEDEFFEIDDSKTLAFTGHRPEKLPDFGDENSASNIAIKAKLKELIESEILEGFSLFMTGMAEGFDSYAARAVIELKDKYPNISLFCVKPFEDFSPSKTNNFIWENADIQLVIKNSKPKSRNGFIEALFERNTYLANNSTCLITYNTQEKGGTAHTIKLAKSKGSTVINIANILKK